MKKRRIGEFTRYSLTTSITQGLLLICAVAASVITARILGPTGKGQMSLALLIPTLATTFGRLGIGHAINYYSSKTERSSLIFNSFVLGATISSLLISLTALVVCMGNEWFLTGIGNNLLFLVVLSIPVFLFNNITTCLIQGMYRITLCNLLSALQSILNVVLLLIVVYFFNKGVTGAVLASISAISAAVFISLLFLFTKVELRRARFDWSLIRSLVEFGSKSHVGNILKDLSYRGDILIISYFLSPASVGHYVIAVTVAEILWKFPDAVGTVLLPKVAAMTSDAARVFTPKACRMIIIPVIVSCVAIFFLGSPVITSFFGKEYEPSAVALLFLLPGVFSLSIWKILANDLIGQGYPMLYSITSGVALISMVVIDIVLVPFMGINGASIGSSVSYTLATAIIIIFYVKLTGNKVGSLVLPRREDVFYYFQVTCKIYTAIMAKIPRLERADD